MKTIIWYVAKAAEKKGAGKAGTAKTAPELTEDVKKAAVRDGRPVVHPVEIRGEDNGTD